MRLVDPYSALGQWWIRQRRESRLRRNVAVTSFLLLAAGAGWYVAVMLDPSDAEGGSVAFYEVTTERRVTVQESKTSEPVVKVLRSVRRVYVDPETVRSTRVITTPGGVRTVGVVGRAVVHTVPITRMQVITRAGRRVTVARRVSETVAVTRADIRTEVVTEVTTDVRVERETRTERETVTRRETVTDRETVTERDTITVTEPVTVVVTDEVPTTVFVTVTEREPAPEP